MLVLSRAMGESIMIGDDIKVTIYEGIGNEIKVGIMAPRAIPIHRQEIYDKIQLEKKEAA